MNWSAGFYDGQIKSVELESHHKEKDNEEDNYWSPVDTHTTIENGLFLRDILKHGQKAIEESQYNLTYEEENES